MNVNDFFESLPTFIKPPADEHEAALATMFQMARDVERYKDQADGNFLMRTGLFYVLLRLRLQLCVKNSIFSQSAGDETAINRFQHFKKLVEELLRTHRHVHQYATQLGCSGKKA